jgi:hypothetical protein
MTVDVHGITNAAQAWMPKSGHPEHKKAKILQVFWLSRYIAL